MKIYEAFQILKQGDKIRANEAWRTLELFFEELKTLPGVSLDYHFSRTEYLSSLRPKTLFDRHAETLDKLEYQQVITNYVSGDPNVQECSQVLREKILKAKQLENIDYSTLEKQLHELQINKQTSKQLS